MTEGGMVTRYHLQAPLEEVFRHCHTSATGLTSTEARHRLAEWGLNQLEGQEKSSIFSVFIRQFTNWLVVLLMLATIVSWFVGETNQAWIIAAVMLLNASIGTIQEYRAEEALAMFKRLLPSAVRVRRDGKVALVPAQRLVPGDIVLIAAGEAVPADLRLIHATSLKANESMLTGESEPSQKYAGVLHQSDVGLNEIDTMVFAGTHIVEGEGEGVAVSTGSRTLVGSVASLTAATAAPKSPVEKEIGRVSLISAEAAMIVGALIIIVGLIAHHPPTEIMLSTISMMVAVVPEGLLAAVSLTLVLGAMQMVKHRAIVKRLPAVETLGAVTVICTDKTGTLTQNKISLVESKLLKEEPNSDAKKWVNVIAALCNSVQVTSHELIGDAVDLALLQAIPKKMRIKINQQFTKVAILPFDSKRKLMSVVVRDRQGRLFSLVKGAANSMWPRLSGGIKLKAELTPTVDSWAKDGLKIVILALRELSPQEWEKAAQNPEDHPDLLEDSLTPVMLAGLSDPPRVAVEKSLAEARQAGIKTVMVTGDWGASATALGRRIGLFTHEPLVVTGKALSTYRPVTLMHIVRLHPEVLFAEIDPRQKHAIVAAYRAAGEVVAVTGDGVNDAPALKAADIGVAFGKSGTAVARAAADMVLQDDSYKTVIAAVKEGRVIFNNIKKFVFYEFATVAAQVMTVILGLLFNSPPILLPIHIIILDFWIGFLPSLSLGVEPPNPGIMHLPPRSRHDTLLPPAQLWRIVRDGFVAAVGALIAFIITLIIHGWYFGQAIEAGSLAYAKASTAVFATLALFMIGLSLSARSNHRPLFELLKWPNLRLYQAMAASLLLCLAIIYLPWAENWFKTSPLSIWEWIVPLLTALAAVGVEEIAKSIKSNP